MKKETKTARPAKQAAADPEMGNMISEKDEVKNAEEKMRKSAAKKTK